MATFAYLCDVVIDQSQQGTGSGTMLIQSILKHPLLKGIPQWRLKTTYASSFYSRFGFQKIAEDITHMEYFPHK
jgi:N-acetylglutamate synthase-like GNAT family acetyltransferase